MRYRTARRYLPWAGAAYLVAGLLATSTPSYEVFPFFCWFLFPIVPGHEPRYELVVHRLQGSSIYPPKNYQELKRVRDPKAMDLWIATQQLGAAIEDSDLIAISRLRTMLETNYLCAPSHYTLDRVEFDPLERWHRGYVGERETLATFTSTAGCRSIPWS